MPLVKVDRTTYTRLQGYAAINGQTVSAAAKETLNRAISIAADSVLTELVIGYLESVAGVEPLNVPLLAKPRCNLLEFSKAVAVSAS